MVIKMNLPWLNRRPKQRPRQRVPLPWSNLTLDQWRAREASVHYARDLMEQPPFQGMLAVLHNSMPVPDISDPARAGLEAARVRGYVQAVHVLMAMSMPAEQDKPEMEPTYEKPVEDLIDIEESE